MIDTDTLPVHRNSGAQGTNAQGTGAPPLNDEEEYKEQDGDEDAPVLDENGEVALPKKGDLNAFELMIERALKEAGQESAEPQNTSTNAGKKDVP